MKVCLRIQPNLHKTSAYCLAAQNFDPFREETGSNLDGPDDNWVQPIFIQVLLEHTFQVWSGISAKHHSQLAENRRCFQLDHQTQFSEMQGQSWNEGNRKNSVRCVSLTQ